MRKHASQQVPNIKEFFEVTKRDIEKKITTMIHDKSILSILNGGKRLRALLAQLSFKVCTGGKETPYQYQRALEGTVGIELAHAASVVHDDIIDKDVKRRGKTAFHIKKGIPNALLTGHKMIAIGSTIALSHSEKNAKLYIDTWNEALNGQLKEVNFDKKSIKNNTNKALAKSKFFRIYKRIINMKTASLFSASCKAGGLEADAKGPILSILAEYGREIGLAYQLADDFVDLENGEMINSVIIPLLNRLENKTVSNNSIKIKSLKKKLGKNASKIKQLYIEEIKQHVKIAEELSKSEIIPPSPYKDLLTEAPTYIVNKMLEKIDIVI